jgi:hypothetical protein
MVGFIGTSLQLQLVITAHTVNFWTTSVWHVCMKNLSLLSESWIGLYYYLNFYNFHVAGIEVTPPKVHYCFMNALSRKPCINSPSNGLVSFSKCYPLLRNSSCLATCYLATTRSLLFVVTGTWFPIRCSAVDVCFGSPIPAFSRHVRI